MFCIRAATNVIYQRFFVYGMGNFLVSELQQRKTDLKLRPSAMSTLPVQDFREKLHLEITSFCICTWDYNVLPPTCKSVLNIEKKVQWLQHPGSTNLAFTFSPQFSFRAFSIKKKQTHARVTFEKKSDQKLLIFFVWP